MLWRIDELILLFAFFAALIAASEVGFGMGMRHSDQSLEADRAHFGALQASVLGLLALLLGFTFGIGIGRPAPRHEI